MAGEFERIRHLRALFGAPPAGVSLGIGDDAALIEPPVDEQIVWTIDACVENVHFRQDIASWEDVGFRSFMAAASDLAAMAAHPIGALSSVSLPRGLEDADLYALARGQSLAARQVGTAVIGGNLSAGDVVTVSTTLLGRTRRAPRRDGARPGDRLALCGDVGLAAAGLRMLLRDPGCSPSDDPERQALLAWRRPRARIKDGLRCGGATSLIDVSDGLAQDALHIASASGVRIDVDTSVVITGSLGVVAERLGVDARELVLSGGEDYALLGTFAETEVPEGFVVGVTCSEGCGVWADGEPAGPTGHDHFR
jgi:thiamine-monophosphate kinase